MKMNELVSLAKSCAISDNKNVWIIIYHLVYK